MDKKQKLLFNLKTDPEEQQNIINKNKNIEKQMDEEITLFEQANKINYSKFHQKNTGELKLDKEVKDRLRALGYIN